MARIDHRDFILKGTAAAAGLAGLGLPKDVLAQQTGRKLGTCGPPPQKSPQRQTSAEGMPPLPLPAVPLRRSEPKAEPTPPLMIAKLEYGTTQDWNTDPGDACCGRREFADAFRAEVRKMFPQRPLDLLEMDHPVFRAFHKYTAVNYRSYKAGTKSETQGPPEILGMNLGCRAAVLLTPWDMSCGWDNHAHEHGARLLPGDAVRLGINIVSYVAALRHVAEVQSVTREVSGPNDP